MDFNICVCRLHRPFFYFFCCVQLLRVWFDPWVPWAPWGPWGPWGPCLGLMGPMWPVGPMRPKGPEGPMGPMRPMGPKGFGLFVFLYGIGPRQCFMACSLSGSPRDRWRRPDQCMKHGQPAACRCVHKTRKPIKRSGIR